MEIIEKLSILAEEIRLRILHRRSIKHLQDEYEKLLTSVKELTNQSSKGGKEAL